VVVCSLVILPTPRWLVKDQGNGIAPVAPVRSRAFDGSIQHPTWGGGGAVCRVGGGAVCRCWGGEGLFACWGGELFG
jgi:hypothetical protein